MGILDATPQAREYDGTARRIVATIRHSVLLSMATFGAILVSLGYVLQTGPWAAILATWGFGLVLVGVVGFLYIQWQRN